MAKPINSIIDGISHIKVIADASKVNVSTVISAMVVMVYPEWICFLANKSVRTINAKNNIPPNIKVDISPLAR